MSFLKTIEEAVYAINACGGIALFEGCESEIFQGELGKFVTVTEYEDTDGKLRTSRRTCIGLVYPGIAGSISILAKDAETDQVFLTEPKGIVINMQYCVDLEDYIDVFNKSCRYAGPDTDVRLEEIAKFSV